MDTDALPDLGPVPVLVTDGWDMDAVRFAVRSLLEEHAPTELRLSTRVSFAYLAPSHQRTLPVASYVDLTLDDDQVRLTVDGTEQVFRVPPLALAPEDLEAYETYRRDGTAPVRAAGLALLTGHDRVGGAR